MRIAVQLCKKIVDIYTGGRDVGEVPARQPLVQAKSKVEVEQWKSKSCALCAYKMGPFRGTLADKRVRFTHREHEVTRSEARRMNEAKVAESRVTPDTAVECPKCGHRFRVGRKLVQRNWHWVSDTQCQNERKTKMSRKLMGFASRKVAAFLAGMVVGIVVGGCSVFGPGIGASVY